MPRPKTPIGKFTDLQSFLNAHVSDMKKLNPRWSVGVWQSKLGIGSRTTLIKILNGQRIPGPKMKKALVKYFNFETEDADHFQSLIQLKKNSANRQVREAILTKIQNRKESVPKQGLDKSTQSLLAHWYHLPLLAMIHSRAFTQDPETLSKLFRDPVTKTQIEKALKLFLENGLVTSDKNGRLSIAKNWQMLRPVQITPQNDEVRNAIMAAFQEQLELTRSRLPALPADEKDLRTVCVTMKRSNVPYARELIRQFTDKFSELLTEEDATDVYQLQTQFFPITKTLRNQDK